ncbi:MAG: hypothetical protein H2184_15675 [Candidatus Galacturonibacter soehngenii]|nr:hypothetical protein [Candidatus Galacturonibacter soehngenii]
MYHNIEKLVRSCYTLVIQEERYGDGILIGLDYQRNGTVLFDLIDTATSPGDSEAMRALFAIEDLSKECPEFLYARENTLEEGLKHLEKRAEKWNFLDEINQNIILEKLDKAFNNTDIC